MGRNRHLPIITSIQELFSIYFDSTQPLSLYIGFTTSANTREDSVPLPLPDTNIHSLTALSTTYQWQKGRMQPRYFSQCAVVQMAVVV